MPTVLHLVDTAEEISQSLQAFNNQAESDPDLARSLLNQTSYWVWDPTTEYFGPSKFVGFKRMTMSAYSEARDHKHSGASFNGTITRERIASVIRGEYLADKTLEKALDKWGKSIIPSESVFDGVDRSKWRFITLSSAVTGQDWSADEVQETITDYFDMLVLELAGTRYSKTSHRKQLMKKLHGRSKGAIEFKHANISAILNEDGFPYIEGYKPRDRYQTALRVAVEGFLESHPGVVTKIEEKLVEPPPKAVDVTNLRIQDIEEEPPTPPATTKKTALPRVPRKIDWEKVNAAQKHLGNLGEDFVFQLEKRYLTEAGRADLASQVTWVSKDEGDGLGYDVRSYDLKGKPKHIEVKTTNGGKGTPFLITTNEVLASEAHPMAYWLYRVFKFSRGAPGLYRLAGSLSECLTLEPTVYMGRPKG
jgi:hypothetical protein